MPRSILTVITPAESTDLTTLDTLKEELGITNELSDNILKRHIEEASGLIESYTGRIFAQETVKEVFKRDWRGMSGNIPSNSGIYLRRTPITEIISIIEDDGDPLIQDVNYNYDPDTGEVFRLYGSVNSYWVGLVTEITYTAGYLLLGNLPRVIEQACLTICRQRWSSRKRDPMVKVIDVPGVMRQEYWVGSTGDNGAIPPEVEGLLEPYCVRNI